MSIKDNQLIFRCFGCKKNYKKEFNKELIKRFANIYEFCNEDIDKFIFLLRKGVYPYQYMDSWERFDSDTVQLSDVFEAFRAICIEIYELYQTHFLSAPGLAWQACLKKTDVKLELLTDVDMSLMVEKGIRGGICHAILRYAKANNKYMKDYNEDEEESFLQYDDANNLYGFAMIQPLPVN